MAAKQDDLYTVVVDVQKQLMTLQMQMNDFCTRFSTQNEITNLNLQSINDHLARLNSKVATHEKIIQERAEVVSDFKHFKESIEHVPERVRKLEDQALTTRSIWKFLAAIFAGGIALGGLVVGVVELMIK